MHINAALQPRRNAVGLKALVMLHILLEFLTVFLG